jgi:hypothetical protein
VASPELSIVNPTSGQYFKAAGLSSQVAVQFIVIAWDPWPAPGKSARCYLDGELSGETGSNSYLFPMVPFGMHRLTCALTLDGDSSSMGCLSTDTVTVKVRKVCASSEDCVDSNPCSTDVCVPAPSGKFCSYADDPTFAGCCCVSAFDCPCYLHPNGATSFDVCPADTHNCALCTTGLGCDDGNDCTVDSCKPCKGCSHKWTTCP